MNAEYEGSEPICAGEPDRPDGEICPTRSFLVICVRLHNQCPSSNNARLRAVGCLGKRVPSGQDGAPFKRACRSYSPRARRRAAEGWRSPRPVGWLLGPGLARSVLECASPLALWPRPTWVAWSMSQKRTTMSQEWADWVGVFW